MVRLALYLCFRYNSEVGFLAMMRKVADTPGSFAKAGYLEIFVEQVYF
jgi:hypothetical protein